MQSQKRRGWLGKEEGQNASDLLDEVKRSEGKLSAGKLQEEIMTENFSNLASI